jgi:6-phosphogluconolactonase
MEEQMIEFQTKDKLEESLCKRMADIIREAIKEKGIAKLLLSGGGTPQGIYHRLSFCELDWSKVEIGLVDERFVSVNSEFSNQKMISEILLQNSAKEARLRGMIRNIDDYYDNLDQVNEYYQELVQADIVLLGMGNDGHTASIFPDDRASLQCIEDVSPLVRNTNAPSHPVERISLNKPFISNANHVFLMITGDKKRKVFIQSNIEKKPIYNFKDEITEVYFTTN